MNKGFFQNNKHKIKHTMKNFITYCIITMAVIFLFTSCGSSLTVTKRHYNKGYHVSFNKIKQSDRSNVNEIENDQLVNSDENKIFDSSLSMEESTSNSSISEDIFTDEVNSTDDQKVVVQTDKKQPEKLFNSTMGMSENVQSTYTKIKNSFSDQKELKTPQPREDGLSLLWIVILVILILWAIGFIGGNVGGLIHLLLVIALILLILWLLGII